MQLEEDEVRNKINENVKKEGNSHGKYAKGSW